jgi:PAS domain S-box-containing protein
MNRKKFIEEHYEELLDLLDCIKVGIYIGDGEGKTLLVNKESEKTGGISREELRGMDMKDLLDVGYVTESSILNSIKSQREEDIIQELGDGGQVYITGVPVIEKGKVDIVVCTERDITEANKLKSLLEETKANAQLYGKELEYLRLDANNTDNLIVSESYEMSIVLEKAKRVADLDTTVLLLGESGTGKELLAEYIFKNSKNKNKAFIKINCAAIPENLIESEFFGYEKGSFTGAEKEGKTGIFEACRGGTLFLDEIGDLPVQMQSKFLRVLQEKEIRRIGGKENISVDVRIVAATNVDLLKAVEDGRFREDLYYRLNVIPILMPPLRTRKEDVEPLTLHFIDLFNNKYRLNKMISSEGIESLKAHDWPGNVRELSNVIERSMIGYDGDLITKFQVERQLAPSHSHEEHKMGKTSLKETMEKYEKDILINMLSKYNNYSEVARMLNIDKATVSRKIKKYNLG